MADPIKIASRYSGLVQKKNQFVYTPHAAKKPFEALRKINRDLKKENYGTLIDYPAKKRGVPFATYITVAATYTSATASCRSQLGATLILS